MDPDSIGGQTLPSAANVAQDLVSRKLALTSLIESLKDSITSEDASVRTQSIRHLSSVIAHLPSEFLTQAQVLAVGSFLCARIADDGALAGILALQQCRGFRQEVASMTLNAVIEYAPNVRLLPQDRRMKVLQVLHELLRVHRKAVQQHGDEAIISILTAIEGEKDPRNLMIVFSILHVLIAEWDISSHVEQFFDAVFCYFPITFRPPPNDPYRITAQDLKIRLRTCMAASALFAPYAFPQLLEKLDTTSAAVKDDVLQTILACVRAYDSLTVASYAVLLWDSLKFEILNVTEIESADKALEILCSISTRLEDRTPQHDFTRYVECLAKDCSERIQEPQQKQASAASRMLYRVGQSSPAALVVIVQSALPLLMTAFGKLGSLEERAAMLQCVTQILQAADTTDDKVTKSSSPVAQTLGFIRDPLTQTLDATVSATRPEEWPLREAALECLTCTMKIAGLWSRDELSAQGRRWTDVIFEPAESTRMEVHNAALSCLITIGRNSPEIIRDGTIPQVIARIFQPSVPVKLFHSALTDLLRICIAEPTLSSTLARRLASRLAEVTQDSWDPLLYPSLLSALAFLLRNSTRDASADWNLFLDQTTHQTQLAVKALIETEPAQNRTDIIVSPTSLKALGRLLHLVIARASSERQRRLANEAYTLFSGGNGPTANDDLILSKDANSRRHLLTILSTNILAGLNRECVPALLETNRPNILRNVVQTASETKHTLIRSAKLENAALLIGKFWPTDALDQVGQLLWEPEEGLLVGALPSEAAVQVAFSVAKALLLRGYKVERLAGVLLQQVENDQIGASVAGAFRLLVAPDDLLSAASGCVVRPLGQQRFFQTIVNSIAGQLASATPTRKQGYLLALSGLLQHVKRELLVSDVPKLLPLLLQSLDSKDASIRTTAVKSSSTIIEGSNTAWEGHYSSLMQRLLAAATPATEEVPMQTLKTGAGPAANTLTATATYTSTELRLQALACLQRLAMVGQEKRRLQHRRQVVQALQATLDDSQRNVRKAAVDCRAAWLALEDPDVKDDA